MVKKKQLLISAIAVLLVLGTLTIAKALDMAVPLVKYDAESGTWYSNEEALQKAKAAGNLRPYQPAAYSEADKAFGDPNVIKQVKEARRSGKILAFWPQNNGPHRLLGIYDPVTGVAEYVNSSYIDVLFDPEDAVRVKDALSARQTIKIQTHIDGVLIAGGPWTVESIIDKAGNVLYTMTGGR